MPSVRSCDNCQTRMSPYLPRRNKDGQMLCPACFESPRGGYVSAARKDTDPTDFSQCVSRQDDPTHCLWHDSDHLETDGEPRTDIDGHNNPMDFDVTPPRCDLCTGFHPTMEHYHHTEGDNNHREDDSALDGIPEHDSPPPRSVTKYKTNEGDYREWPTISRKAAVDQNSCPHDGEWNLHGQCKKCGYLPPTEGDEPCEDEWCVANEPEHTKGEHCDPPHLDPGHADYHSAEQNINDAIGDHPDAWLFNHQPQGPSKWSKKATWIGDHIPHEPSLYWRAPNNRWEVHIKNHMPDRTLRDDYGVKPRQEVWLHENDTTNPTSKPAKAMNEDGHLRTYTPWNFSSKPPPHVMKHVQRAQEHVDANAANHEDLYGQMADQDDIRADQKRVPKEMEDEEKAHRMFKNLIERTNDDDDEGKTAKVYTQGENPLDEMFPDHHWEDFETPDCHYCGETNHTSAEHEVREGWPTWDEGAYVSQPRKVSKTASNSPCDCPGAKRIEPHSWSEHPEWAQRNYKAGRTDAWGHPVMQAFDGHGAWNCNNYSCAEHPQEMYDEPKGSKPAGMPGWMEHDLSPDRDVQRAVNKAFHDTGQHEDARYLMKQQPQGPTKWSKKTASTDDHETLYHITDRPDFSPNPDLHPQDNAFALQDRSHYKGLYVTDDPDRWRCNGYHRPYVAEIHVPHGVARDERWHGEKFIPANHFDKVKVHRVVPFDAHQRDTYGEVGTVEEYHGTSYHDDSPLSGRKVEPMEHQDARTFTPEQHTRHLKRLRDYLHDVHGYGWNEFNDAHEHVSTDETDDEGMPVRRDREGNVMTRGRYASKNPIYLPPEVTPEKRDAWLAGGHPGFDEHGYSKFHDSRRWKYSPSECVRNGKHMSLEGGRGYANGPGTCARCGDPEKPNIVDSYSQLLLHKMTEGNEDAYEHHDWALNQQDQGPSKWSKKTAKQQEIEMKYAPTARLIHKSGIQVVAHDSGDGETIYHCPFCGSGQVLARSDGTVECEFCHTAFTVQVQPEMSAFPQTINGVPVDVPGMPGEIGAEAPMNPTDLDPGAETGAPGEGGAPPAPGEGDTPPGDVQTDAAEEDEGNPFTSSLKTATGASLDVTNYLRHLVITHAADKAAVVARIRDER